VGSGDREEDDVQVIECNECGETLQAAENEELARILSQHLEAEHEVEVDEEEVTELVESEAYEAMDS
jgi:predicted small metal-binding protein